MHTQDPATLPFRWAVFLSAPHFCTQKRSLSPALSPVLGVSLILDWRSCSHCLLSLGLSTKAAGRATAGG